MDADDVYNILEAEGVLPPRLKAAQQRKEQEMELGQVVRLRSGGPDMTVASISTEPYVTYQCTWFDGDGKYSSCWFDCHEIDGAENKIGFEKKGKPHGN